MSTDRPLPLTDPSYEANAETGLVTLAATLPTGQPVQFAFPAAEAGRHLHGWVTAMQEIADHDGAIGLGEVAEQMIVLQPTELAMAPIGPGRAALVFAFGPVKLAFLVPLEQLGGMLAEVRRQQE